MHESTGVFIEDKEMGDLNTSLPGAEGPQKKAEGEKAKQEAWWNSRLRTIYNVLENDPPCNCKQYPSAFAMAVSPSPLLETLVIPR